MVVSSRPFITTCRQLQDTFSLFHLQRGMRLRTDVFHLFDSLRLFPITKRHLAVGKSLLHPLLPNDGKKIIIPQLGLHTLNIFSSSLNSPLIL